MSKYQNVPHDRLYLYNLQRLLVFLAIGGFTTFTDISILYILTEYAGIWFMYSAFISYCTGAVMSYLLNKKLNFRNESPDYLAQGITFLSITGCCLIFNLTIVYVGVELAEISYIYAKILATGVGFILNYAGQSIITFRRWR